MKPVWTPLHAQVHQNLRDRHLLPRQAKILIAVSGGQDSLCLAQLLLDLRSLWNWNLEVVHCDHRWRSDSAQNATHVRDLAKTWDVNYHEVIAETDVSTEAKARDWRYQSFDTLAQTHGFSHIAIGHTATDRAETLLYNLARGSGAEGLQSMGWSRSGFSITDPQAANLQIVRPLLDLTRSQTGEFCANRSIPVWHDTTNDDLTYRRNRIRQEIMPLLKSALNPQADRHLAQTAELLTADVTFLQAQSQILYDQVVVLESDGHKKIHRHPLASAPLALQRRVLRSFCQSTLKFNPTFDQIEDLILLLKAPPRSQSSTFKGGAIGVVVGDWVLFALDQNP